MNQRTQMINGTQYVYLDEPFWDVQKQRGSHKRKYIGKNIDGQFVPNRSYGLELKLKEKQEQTKPGQSRLRCADVSSMERRISWMPLQSRSALPLT